ncbi:MAG: phasin family protein [Pseudomonadota bacterium]|nr:phasin family protein [Pseudomonadota bacterium]|tara:strand:- start:463 stop:849 length:387 start_codon:yes stop_codon:yes gene_type:complete
MQENILNAFAEQAKTMYSPMSKFNSLFVDNMEKLTEYQLNAVKSYAEMGLSQMKAASDVQDLESMRTFASSQAEIATGMNKKIMEDIKSLSDMTMEFKTQMEGVMEEMRSTAAETAKTTAKATKSKAA